MFETRIPPVVWLALGGLVTWGIGRLDLDGAPLDNRFGVLSGVLLAALGAAIAALGVVQFRQAQTTVNPHNIDGTSHLVTAGIYRITRNPMYLGMLVVLAGWAAVLGTIGGFIVGGGVFFAVVTRLQIIPEERVLADKFGDTYARYTATVRRWI